MGAARFGPTYRETRALTDGTPVSLRLLRASDGASLRLAFERLSPESRYRRFFAHKTALSPNEVEMLTDGDGPDRFAVAAVIQKRNGGDEIIGVARFVRLVDDPMTAEGAITVIDAFQRNGLGRLLVERLLDGAADRGIERIRFFVLAENHAMLSLLRELAPDSGRAVDLFGGGSALKIVLPAGAAPDRLRIA